MRVLNNALAISGVVIAVLISILGYLLALDIANPIVAMTSALID